MVPSKLGWSAERVKRQPSGEKQLQLGRGRCQGESSAPALLATPRKAESIEGKRAWPRLIWA